MFIYFNNYVLCIFSCAVYRFRRRSIVSGGGVSSSCDSPIASMSRPSSQSTSTPIERVREEQFQTCSGELLSQEEIDHRIRIDDSVSPGDFVADVDFDKTMRDVLALSLLDTSGTAELAGRQPFLDISLDDRRPSVSVAPVQRGIQSVYFRGFMVC